MSSSNNLTGSASRPSSSTALGTTTASTAAAQTSSQQQTPRSPGSTHAVTMQNTTATTPGAGTAAQTVPLPSPSASSSTSNRFGLALNFIGRRPRGLTNPSSMTGGGGRSPGASGSPGSELPPSPSGGDRPTSSGYGFPALRRTLSKRQNNSSNSITGVTASTSGQQADSSRHRTGRSRSSSQPPSADTLTQRTRSSNAAIGGSVSAGNSQDALPSGPSPTDATPAVEDGPASSASATSDATYRLRLVPHLESSRSLHFEPVDRDLSPFRIVKVGRFTDRSQQTGTVDPTRIAFKSKVVSRGHAEIWVDDAGKFFIKDTKSSSGTFLNHIRLSAPNVESRAFPLKDGDVLQLGVDYQGGTEEIYRCVKMRVELNRAWQRGNNAFNTAALAQIRALGGATPTVESKPLAPAGEKMANPSAPAGAASITDCCICLYPVTVCQALFIAPCSHVTHYKCIRPLVQQNYPGFCCPLCRTYADLEADVEIEPAEVEEPAPGAASAPPTVNEEPEREALLDEVMSSVDEVEEPPSHAASRAPSIRSRPSSVRNADTSSISRASMSGLARSRPASLNEQQASDAAAAAPASLPAVAAALEMQMQPDSDAYMSLASAATPPNNTFLSTLADGARLPRMSGNAAGPSPLAISRENPPVGLEQALLAHKATALSTSGHAAVNGDEAGQDRKSIGSDTDRASKDGNEEMADATSARHQPADGSNKVAVVVFNEENTTSGSSGGVDVKGKGRADGTDCGMRRETVDKASRGDDMDVDAVDPQQQDPSRAMES
ncbi:hypothetical protein OIV83_003042 [Microbotryomycetes sp. JL201]|nr:hypothetical protein OIV83_003042 [Microbotryomycetes sp. JL201]